MIYLHRSVRKPKTPNNIFFKILISRKNYLLASIFISAVWSFCKSISNQKHHLSIWEETKECFTKIMLDRIQLQMFAWQSAVARLFTLISSELDSWSVQWPNLIYINLALFIYPVDNWQLARYIQASYPRIRQIDSMAVPSLHDFRWLGSKHTDRSSTPP